MQETAFNPGTLCDAHVALQVNVAVLDFAKKLPLEELRMIGYQPPVSTSVKRSHMTNTGEDYAQFLLMSRKPMTNPRSLSLTPTSMNSKWSFACRSARRIEGDCAASDCNGNASSFGSLEVWGIDNASDETGTGQNGPVGLNTSDSMRRLSTPSISNARKTLGDARNAGISASGRLERTLSFTQESVDSCDLFLKSIGLPVPETTFPMMSDEEFEALPNWSDVENDTEYNEVEERSSHWSNSDSSYSSRASMDADFVFPRVWVPSGYPEMVTTNTRDGYKTNWTSRHG